MINIATFTPRFFVLLVKELKKYNSLFVTEDGNIYRSEKSAIAHISEKEKIAHTNDEGVKELRYARIDWTDNRLNIPRDANALERMFESQYKRRIDSKREAAKQDAITLPEMSDEEAEAILNGIHEANVPVLENSINVKGMPYEFTEVRAAMRATVTPKLSHVLGYEKTQAAYEELTEEEKEQVYQELIKKNK